MSFTLLPALVSFAFVSSVTPGPNNLMLMTSGVNFGFRRTLPHMLGVALGFGVMVFLVGIGIAGLFAAVPQSRLVLTAVSVAYMLWLAWKIAHAAAPRAGQAAGRPFGFFQAAGFQWVNPKAWAMALTATTAYAPEASVRGAFVVAAVFALINLPSVSLWVAAGQRLRRWLSNPRRLRIFNLVMAVTLVASIYPLLGMEG